MAIYRIFLIYFIGLLCFINLTFGMEYATDPTLEEIKKMDAQEGLPRGNKQKQPENPNRRFLDYNPQKDGKIHDASGADPYKGPDLVGTVDNADVNAIKRTVILPKGVSKIYQTIYENADNDLEKMHSDKKTEAKGITEYNKRDGYTEEEEINHSDAGDFGQDEIPVAHLNRNPLRKTETWENSDMRKETDFKHRAENDFNEESENNLEESIEANEDSDSNAENMIETLDENEFHTILSIDLNNGTDQNLLDDEEFNKVNLERLNENSESEGEIEELENEGSEYENEETETEKLPEPNANIAVYEEEEDEYEPEKETQEDINEESSEEKETEELANEDSEYENEETETEKLTEPNANIAVYEEEEDEYEPEKETQEDINEESSEENEIREEAETNEWDNEANEKDFKTQELYSDVESPEFLTDLLLLEKDPESLTGTIPAEHVDPACSLPSKTGFCKAHIPRFYYNIHTQECETFVYGGCGSNDNNFKTIEECMQTCSQTKV